MKLNIGKKVSELEIMTLNRKKVWHVLPRGRTLYRGDLITLRNHGTAFKKELFSQQKWREGGGVEGRYNDGI